MLIALQVPPRPAPPHLITMETATPPALIDSRLINDLRSPRARLFLFAVRSVRHAMRALASGLQLAMIDDTPPPPHVLFSQYVVICSVVAVRAERPGFSLHCCP